MAAHALFSPRQRRRLLTAGCVSLLVHGWAAWELPARMPSSGKGGRPFSVTLRPLPRAPAPASASTGEAANRAQAEARGVSDLASGRVHDKPSRLQAVRDGPRQDAAYYPARELDDYPRLLVPLSIPYPEQALAEQRGGRVLLVLKIGATGKVDEVAVDAAEPRGYFEEAAQRALRAAAFTPGRRNGLPVRSRLLIQLRFDPATAAAAAE